MTGFLERNELRVLHLVLGLVARVEYIKVQNYIENVVINYIDKDFIMHFRLSTVVAYGLIERFTASDIFNTIQGIYIFF